MRKRLLFIVFFTISFTAAYGQTIHVSGQVSLAADGIGMPGITVTEKGTSNGTITDEKGHYVISVRGNATLIFQAIGSLTQEVMVGGRSTIDINLQPDNKGLNEVVVTALGIKRERKSLGYATEQVSGEDLTIAQAPTVATGLMGKVAGLNISNSGGGVEGASSRIVVRGNTSFTGDNRALIVVDGVFINNDPINNNPVNGGNSALANGSDVSNITDWGTGLNFIDPDDIESINVLKGPAASALYGAKGGNGAIIITRKKGKKQQGLGVEYSFSFRKTQVYQYLDFQNEYGSGGVSSMYSADTKKQFPYTASGQRYQIGMNPTSGPVEAFAFGNLPADQPLDFGGTLSYPSGLSFGPKFDNQPILWYDGVLRPYAAHPNNWKAFYPDGYVATHSVSVSGGNDFGSIRFSYNRTDNKANVLNSKYNTNTYSLGSNINISNKLRFELTGSYVNYQRLNIPSIGSGYAAGVTYAMQRDYDPAVEKMNDFGPNGSQRDVVNAYTASGVSYPYNGGYMQNVYWTVYENNIRFNRNQLVGGAHLIADITPWLNITGSAGLDNSSDITETKNYPTDIGGLVGKYAASSAKSLNRNLDAVFRLHKDSLFSNKFNASLSGGVGNYYRNDYSISNTTSGNFVTPFIFALDNSANTPTSATEIRYVKKVNSAYGFLDLAYNNYLFLQLTGRNDWSSTLPNGNNSYFYPSANVSYVFTDAIENIKNSLPWLTFGKIRLSYAETGTDTDPYSVVNVVNTTPYNGQGAQVFPAELKDENVKPQRTRAYEAGLNLGFLQGRLSIDVSVYSMKSFNQILSTSLPISSGFNSIKVNRGALGNKGVEFVVNATPIETPNFTWHLSLNGAHNNNKVLALAEGINELQIGNFFGTSGISEKVKVGDSYGTLYGRDFTYLNGQKVVKRITYPGTDEVAYYTVGNKKYVSGTEYVLTDSEVPIGNATPFITGGISNTFRYKNFSLYALIDGSFGGDLYSGTYSSAMGNGLLKSTLKERDGGGLPLTYPDGTTSNTGVILDGVFADGTKNTDVVHYLYYYLGNYQPWNHLGIPRSPSVFENNWLKLREFAISYQVPKRWVEKTKVLQDLSISFIGRDLFYIYASSPKGINPEGVNGIGNVQGIEYSAMPRIRSYGVTVKTSF